MKFDVLATLNDIVCFFLIVVERFTYLLSITFRFLSDIIFLKNLQNFHFDYMIHRQIETNESSKIVLQIYFQHVNY